MSYSFLAKGDTKQAALVAAAEKFDTVCQQMPVHERDRTAVLANLRSCVDLAAEPDAGDEVQVSMHGSMWVDTPTAGPMRVRSINIGCNVSVNPKLVQQPTTIVAPATTP